MEILVGVQMFVTEGEAGAGLHTIFLKGSNHEIEQA
jgi:hypothetical protein